MLIFVCTQYVGKESTCEEQSGFWVALGTSPAHNGVNHSKWLWNDFFYQEKKKWLKSNFLIQEKNRKMKERRKLKVLVRNLCSSCEDEGGLRCPCWNLNRVCIGETDNVLQWFMQQLPSRHRQQRSSHTGSFYKTRKAKHIIPLKKQKLKHPCFLFLVKKHLIGRWTPLREDRK